MIRAKTTFNRVNNIGEEEATRRSHRVLQDIDRKAEHRPLPTQSQAILQQIPYQPQEKLLQLEGHQFLEQSSSACRERHLS